MTTWKAGNVVVPVAKGDSGLILPNPGGSGLRWKHAFSHKKSIVSIATGF